MKLALFVAVALNLVCFPLSHARGLTADEVALKVDAQIKAGKTFYDAVEEVGLKVPLAEMAIASTYAQYVERHPELGNTQAYQDFMDQSVMFPVPTAKCAVARTAEGWSRLGYDNDQVVKKVMSEFNLSAAAVNFMWGYYIDSYPSEILHDCGQSEAKSARPPFVCDAGCQQAAAQEYRRMSGQ